MGNITKSYRQNELIKQIIIVIIAGVTSGLALNLFLTPAHVFSAGVNGISQLMSAVLIKTTGVHINTGILIFALNIPIAGLSWIKLGKSATIFSLLTVGSVSVAALIIPIIEVTSNPLTNAIAGGVLTGVASGLSMKYGFNTGGMDIVSLVLAKTTGKTVGTMLLVINGIIVLFAGFLFSWESALYTIISIFCMTQVVDNLHTRHQKVTAFITTQKTEAMISGIQNELTRGMTLMPGVGVYSRQELSVIMIVLTRYELYTLEQVAYDVDKQAFINIVPTQSIVGQFFDEDQQKNYEISRLININ